jgi:hypothetical protein
MTCVCGRETGTPRAWVCDPCKRAAAGSRRLRVIHDDTWALALFLASLRHTGELYPRREAPIAETGEVLAQLRADRNRE